MTFGTNDKKISSLDSHEDPEVGFVKQSLERFRKKLLDLSRRNRLLNFKDGARTIRVVDELPDAIFDLVVNQEKHLEFLPTEENLSPQLPEVDQAVDSVESNQTVRPISYALPDRSSISGEKKGRFLDGYLQTVHDPKKLELKLKKIHAEHQRIIEETGTSTLYMGIGFLEWFESDDSAIPNRAPLILIPINVERTRFKTGKGGTIKYALEYDGQDLQYNISLAEFLKKDFDIVLPELPSDDEEILPEDYFEIVSKAVESQKRWSVKREIAVDFFSFAKLFMFLDLDAQRWSNGSGIVKHKLIRQLFGVEQNGESSSVDELLDLDDDPIANRIPLILDADSSQHRVVFNALNEKSLVVEGPPGTGKSQTITNLIAALLEQGKTVLFVAEKLAALQVVKRRLDSIGVGPFVLELHSHKVNKQQIHANIRERLDHFPGKPKGLEESRGDLERRKELLSNYVKIINSEFEGTGLRIFDIFWKYDDLLSRNSDLSNIDISQPEASSKAYVSSIEEILAQVERLYAANGSKFHSWKGTNLANLNPANIDQFKGLIKKLTSVLGDFQTEEQIQKELFQETRNANFAELEKYGSVLIKEPLSNALNFTQSVASACAQSDNVIFFRNFLDDIHKTEKLVELALRDLPKIDSVEDAKFHEISTSYSALVNSGLSEKSSDELEQIHDCAVDFTQSVSDLLADIYPVLKEMGFREPRSIDEIAKIKVFLEIVVKQINSQFVDQISSLTMDASFDEICFTAIQQVKALIERAKDFSLDVLVDKCPDHGEVKNAIILVAARQDKWFNFINSELRSVRKQSKIWLGKDTSDLQELHAQLTALSKYLVDITVFDDQSELKARLGDKFSGIKSNWTEIETFSKAITQLRQNIPNNEILRSITKSFRSFREKAAQVLTGLELFLRSSDGLMNKVKLLTQDMNLARNISIDTKQESALSSQNEKLAALAKLIDVNLKSISSFLSSSRDPIKKFKESFDSEAERRKLLATLQSRESQIINNLGDSYRGLSEDSSHIETTLSWCMEIFRRLPPRDAAWVLSESSEQRYKSIKERYAKVYDLISTLKTLERDLESFGDIEEKKQNSSSLKWKNTTDLSVFISNASADLDAAFQWGDLCRCLIKLKKEGLENLVQAIEQDEIPKNRIRECYLLSLYRCQSLAIFRANPSLVNFSRQEHEGIREKFKELDRNVQLLLALDVCFSLSQRRIPEGRSIGKVKEFSDMGLIRHELQKKKRHVPVRQLVRRSGSALQALKPCFMMSPLSVAQFIPPEGIKFDVVVMDEASQLKPEDCLGAIARGKQVVVVGDSNQLPPTQFFDRLCDDADDSEEETNMDDMESILDVCAKVYHPTQRLLWHYRSEHEDLIRFSNFHFYNQSLMLFPSPYRGSKQLGVHHHFVEEGYFAAGRNQRESEVVARAVLQHLKDHPDQSLGVGTFNQEQRDLIRDQIELALEESPELIPLYEQAQNGVEPFFVKNLENIQGDERDVIFISTTYGPDREAGKVYQRFGPINSPLGWRRLNVIFTRAKKRMDIFTSLKSDDIIVGDQSSKGIRMLKQYIKYSECKELVELGEITDRGPDSDFEISVGEVLRQLGYEFEPNLGVAGFFIDIAVRHPERRDVFMIGIECDGAAYHSSKSARDRDRLREEILVRKGWKLHRIWSTDWFKNRKSEIDRLARMLSESSVSTFN